MQAQVVAETVFEHGSQLVLRDDFACAVGQGVGARLPRIGGELCGGQAQGVHGVGHVEGVGDHFEAGALLQVGGEHAVELLALGPAARAVSVGVEGTVVGHDAHTACAPAGLPVGAAQAVAAQGDLRVSLRLRACFACGGLDHAARRIAVQLRQWSREHFDALGRCQAHGRGLALPVGNGGGNAIGDQANTAQAKGGTCAEATDGDLHVLCVVVTVERHHARHLAQGLGQVDLRASVADGLAIDHRHRSRGVQLALQHTPALDHDFIGVLGVRRGAQQTQNTTPIQTGFHMQLSGIRCTRGPHVGGRLEAIDSDDVADYRDRCRVSASR